MDSSTSASSAPQRSVLKLTPGFHFKPTDDELVLHYLRPKLAGQKLPLPIFFDERILNYHPDELIERYRKYGEDRWFFFTTKERKHAGSNRQNRTTAGNGHWNATGSVRPVRSRDGALVGCVRSLVFYEASRTKTTTKKNQGAPADAKGEDGVKTDWTMLEYESLTSEAEFQAIRDDEASNKMDVLVLCTIQKKKNNEEGETKIRRANKRKTKEEGLQDVPVGGEADKGSGAGGKKRKGTAEGQDGDQVQRTLMQPEPLQNFPYWGSSVDSRSRYVAGQRSEPQASKIGRLGGKAEWEQSDYGHHAPAGVGGFIAGPNGNMPPYYFTAMWATPLQETAMAPARGHSHTLTHQEDYYLNHSMNMNNSHFQAHATVPQSNAKMGSPPVGGGGSSTMLSMLQNRVNMGPLGVGNDKLQNMVNMAPAQAQPFYGSGPGLSGSNYGYAYAGGHGNLSTSMDHRAYAGGYGHLRTSGMDHPEPSSLPFQPSLHSYGAGSINIHVNVNHQNPAASMAGTVGRCPIQNSHATRAATWSPKYS